MKMQAAQRSLSAFVQFFLTNITTSWWPYSILVVYSEQSAMETVLLCEALCDYTALLPIEPHSPVVNL